MGLIHVSERAKKQLQLARAKDEAELSLALSQLKESRKRIRSVLKKFNDYRMEIFAMHADLHFVLTQMPQIIKERDQVVRTLRDLHTKIKTVKLTLRQTSRIELEFRANLRDALAKAELAEMQQSGHVQNPVVEAVREQAVEAKIAAIETSNAKANAEGAIEKCRKSEAMNTIAFDEMKQTGMDLKNAQDEALEASDAFASTTEGDSTYKLREKENLEAQDSVENLRKLFTTKKQKARAANIAVAKTCSMAEFMEMEAATVHDQREEAIADMAGVKKGAKENGDKQVLSAASDANVALRTILDANSFTGMTGVSSTGGAESDEETGSAGTGGDGVPMAPSMDTAHEQQEADQAESDAKKAELNEKANEKADAKKEQMKLNATDAVAKAEREDAQASNASATIDEELKGPDAEFVNKSVERVREDAEAAAAERKLNGEVKKVELASEMSQDALMRNLVQSTKEALKADQALHKGAHNATVYSFKVPKKHCLTCNKHKATMNMSRSAAKASELSDAAGLTSRSVDHRMQVAKMQVELNARRAQTELDEAVASQIKLLEKRVNKSNDKADKTLLLKEPAEANLTEAAYTAKEMKIKASEAKAKFVEARGKYQVALKEEENQKAELAKKEREWKARVEEKKQKVTNSRVEVVESQTNEEKKKLTKNKARMEVLKFKNPYRIEHARARANLSEAEIFMEEARNAEKLANRTLKMVTNEFKLAEYHHSRWSEKLRKRFGYKEQDMEGGTPAGVHGLNEYVEHSPTGATGMAKLSPEDLKEMEASPDDVGDLATGSTGASGTTGATGNNNSPSLHKIFSNHLSGATGVRFKSVTTGSTGDAGIVDVETTEDNLNDDQANEVDTVKKIANKGYALITKYSDAHKLLVDVANKKDE